MTQSGALNELVERTVEGMGYEFVELERLARGLVRVTIDTTAEGGISLEDCERVSDQLTHLFTVEDIPYERLEVSSPGVERPLKRARDWDRFAGELDEIARAARGGELRDDVEHDILGFDARAQCPVDRDAHAPRLGLDDALAGEDHLDL